MGWTDLVLVFSIPHLAFGEVRKGIAMEIGQYIITMLLGKGGLG